MPASSRLASGEPPSRLPGLLLGMGFGGLFDGIVIHQLLQWHHMVSSTRDHPMTTLAGLEANTFADGLFHALTWVLLLAGTLLMLVSWQRGRLAPTWFFHIGLLLAGWGLFNVVEGIINHQVLGVHHVRDDLGGPLAWDLGFLAVGALQLIGGWGLHRAGAKDLRSRAILQTE